MNTTIIPLREAGCTCSHIKFCGVLCGHGGEREKVGDGEKETKAERGATHGATHLTCQVLPDNVKCMGSCPAFPSSSRKLLFAELSCVF
jgi:hypothetical protein